MLDIDEDALICDLAETYHILDYQSLPMFQVAILAFGLNESSRIKLKINDSNLSLNEMMLAVIVDRLGILLWQRTEDGMKNRNHPMSVFKLLSKETEEKDIVVFDSGEDFMKAWQALNEGGG